MVIYYNVVWRKQRAYTLMELLLAMSLFVALAGGLGYGIMRAVRAHNFETSYRESTLQARSVLDQMVEELRVASIPDEGQALGNNECGIASSIWYPDPYKEIDSPFGDFYKQEINNESSSGASEKRKIRSKRAYNRLIFSRKDPNRTDSYVFVDWFVPLNKRDRIYRVAHNLDMNEGDASKRGILAAPYKFDSTGDKYVFKNPTDYFGNGITLGSALVFGNGNVADYTVAQLPNNFDTFCFGVELEPNDDIYGGATSGVFENVADINNACYSTELARITVKAVVHATADEERDDEDGNPFVEESSERNQGKARKRVIVMHEQAYISR